MRGRENGRLVRTPPADTRLNRTYLQRLQHRHTVQQGLVHLALLERRLQQNATERLPVHRPQMSTGFGRHGRRTATKRTPALQNSVSPKILYNVTTVRNLPRHVVEQSELAETAAVLVRGDVIVVDVRSVKSTAGAKAQRLTKKRGGLNQNN